MDGTQAGLFKRKSQSIVKCNSWYVFFTCHVEYEMPQPSRTDVIRPGYSCERPLPSFVIRETYRFLFMLYKSCRIHPGVKKVRPKHQSDNQWLTEHDRITHRCCVWTRTYVGKFKLLKICLHCFHVFVGYSLGYLDRSDSSSLGILFWTWWTWCQVLLRSWEYLAFVFLKPTWGRVPGGGIVFKKNMHTRQLSQVIYPGN